MLAPGVVQVKVTVTLSAYVPAVGAMTGAATVGVSMVTVFVATSLLA